MRVELRDRMIWVDIFTKYDESGDIFSDALAGFLGTCGTCFMLVGENTLSYT